MGRSFLITACTVLSVAGCGSGSGAPLPPEPPPPPAGPLRMVVVGQGDGQVGYEGEELPQRFEVYVTRDGIPEPGVAVRWEASAGALSVTEAMTTIGGNAATKLRLGTGAHQATVTARVADDPSVAPVMFGVTALERLTVVSDPNTRSQAGRAGEPVERPLALRVTRDGAPRAGVQVQWRASGGTVGASSVTDADGWTSMPWVLPTTTGYVGVVAQAQGAPEQVAFVATVLPGPPADFRLTSGAEVPANWYSHHVGIRATDAYGNLLVGVPVVWSVESGPAIMVRSDSVTSQSGHTSAEIRPTGLVGVIRLKADYPSYQVSTLFDITAVAPRFSILFTFIDFETGEMGFWSRMNGAQPAVDTVPVGAHVTWSFDPDLVPSGIQLEAVPAGTIRFNPYPLGYEAVFTHSGTYVYREVNSGVQGTIVVE